MRLYFFIPNQLNRIWHFRLTNLVWLGMMQGGTMCRPGENNYRHFPQIRTISLIHLNLLFHKFTGSLIFKAMQCNVTT